MNRDEYIKHEVEHIKRVSSLGGNKPCKVWVGKVPKYPRSIIIRYNTNNGYETVEIVGNKISKEYSKWIGKETGHTKGWFKTNECKFSNWEADDLWD